MKFYNRSEELKLLDIVRKRSQHNSEMTLITGRRRIGKTRLILKSLENEKFIYFFVARKKEALLCEEYLEQIRENYDIPVFGTIERFKDLFAFLMEASKRQPFNLVIDEFQEFHYVNPAIYGEIQDIWDRNKEDSRMNLIISGSVYSMMKRIFEQPKEPLFGRATERIQLQGFDVEVLKTILNETNPSPSNKDLLTFYILSGGVAKYVEYLVDREKLSHEAIIEDIFRNNSLFLEEGKNLLIEKFGKDYSTYFSVLSLISSGKTSRQAIESILQRDVGGYLERLEKGYSILKKVKPVLAKPGGRLVKYFIDDNFLNFWFRFIYKYRSAIEIQNFEYVKNIVRRDFEVFSGRFLEKYFKEKLALSKEYGIIGSYWEKGNKNEIDIVAIDDVGQKILFAEVKMNKNRINHDLLKEKAKKIASQYSTYKIDYKGFSLDDM